MEGRGIERRPGRFFTVFLIAILFTAVLFGFLFFLPIRSVGLQETHNVPLGAGVQAVTVDLSIGVGDVNVTFRDLDGDAVSLNFSASGYCGLISPQIPVISVQQEQISNVLSVTSEVNTSFLNNWWSLAFLKVNCDLIVDPSLNATINVGTGTGRISFETRSGVVLDSLTLETMTGAVEASFVEGTKITGDISIKTTTGAVSFSWQNVIVERDIAVNLRSTTGTASINIAQDERLQKKVDLGVEVTTGAINLALTIDGDVSGKITSSTTLGLIDVQRNDGFFGSSVHLQSNNYPSDARFDINLQTTTGGISINALHT